MEIPSIRYLPIAFALLIVTLTASVSSAQEPDLVVSSLEVTGYDGNRISYSYTITNQGTVPAPLNGPTGAEYDNVSVQAFVPSNVHFFFAFLVFTFPFKTRFSLQRVPSDQKK